MSTFCFKQKTDIFLTRPRYSAFSLLSSSVKSRGCSLFSISCWVSLVQTCLELLALESLLCNAQQHGVNYSYVIYARIQRLINYGLNPLLHLLRTRPSGQILFRMSENMDRLEIWYDSFGRSICPFAFHTYTRQLKRWTSSYIPVVWACDTNITLRKTVSLFNN